jgi:hypothetical protein
MKASGKIVEVVVAIMIILLIVLSFAPPLLVGGVVIDQKIDSGYMILLRESQGTWQETNAMLYYAHYIYPWIFFSTIACIAFFTLLRKSKWKGIL